MVWEEGKAADRVVDSLVRAACRIFPLVAYKVGLVILKSPLQIFIIIPL